MKFKKLLKALKAFLSGYIKVKKEEYALKNEIFKVKEISDEAVEEFVKFLEGVVEINEDKTQLKESLMRAFAEFKGGEEFVSMEGHTIEDTGSFRDQPTELGQVEKENMFLGNTDRGFMDSLNNSEINVETGYEDKVKVLPENQAVEIAVENIEVIPESLVESQEGAVVEVGDTTEPELEIFEPDADADTGTDTLQEEVIETTSDKTEEDAYEKGKKIIEEVNRDGIKFSTKVGKVLKEELENLGYIKDVHYIRDKETNTWTLRG